MWSLVSKVPQIAQSQSFVQEDRLSATCRSPTQLDERGQKWIAVVQLSKRLANLLVTYALWSARGWGQGRLPPAGSSGTSPRGRPCRGVECRCASPIAAGTPHPSPTAYCWWPTPSAIRSGGRVDGAHPIPRQPPPPIPALPQEK